MPTYVKCEVFFSISLTSKILSYIKNYFQNYDTIYSVLLYYYIEEYLRGGFMNGRFNPKEFISGDIDSFEYIVNCYEKKLYGFIYNMVRNKSITEDLTQEVFIKVYQNCYKYNSEFPIEPWLFKIAHNLTINYIKKNKNRLKEMTIDEGVTVIPSLENQIESFETRHMILKELESLKPECKAIFILRILEDLPFEQIALMTGTSVAAVKLKFYRSRKVIVKQLRR